MKHLNVYFLNSVLLTFLSLNSDLERIAGLGNFTVLR
jgi:hypothetical protein